MKQYVILIFSVSWFMLAQSNLAQDHNIVTIDQQTLIENLYRCKPGAAPRWYLINLLARDICNDCSIPGSINIPTHKITKKLKDWPRNRKIIIYCAGGDCPLSRYAYDNLKRMGFSDVAVLQGGLRCWKGSMLTVSGPCRAGYLLG